MDLDNDDDEEEGTEQGTEFDSVAILHQYDNINVDDGNGNNDE
jgi:hypothetical protein